MSVIQSSFRLKLQSYSGLWSHGCSSIFLIASLLSKVYFIFLCVHSCCMNSLNSKNIQQQYEGFLETKPLWNASFYGLTQLQLTSQSSTIYNGTLSKSPRLGKRVESFVSCFLQHIKNIRIVHENVQIQKNKRTIGEIDCILYQDNTPIHLEIVFKYYLYDATIGDDEIAHWIGPNRNDSLQQKIEKLASKQFPLLYKEETQKYIDMDVDCIQQRVLFKAQLFVPFANNNVVFEEINAACVAGFYIYRDELSNFTDCKFYIPAKLDWLVVPKKHIDWLSYDAYKELTNLLLDEKKSPLCWLKKSNGELFKFFLVWW